MSVITLFLGNLCRRWRDMCAEKTDGTFVRDFDTMFKSAVIRSSAPISRIGPCGSPTRLRIIRSQQRTVLARKAS